MAEVTFGHDIEACNCDKCRYIRYENTLRVERIEIVNEVPSWEVIAKQQDDNMQRFLEAERLEKIPSFRV